MIFERLGFIGCCSWRRSSCQTINICSKLKYFQCTKVDTTTNSTHRTQNTSHKCRQNEAHFCIVVETWASQHAMYAFYSVFTFNSDFLFYFCVWKCLHVVCGFLCFIHASISLWKYWCISLAKVYWTPCHIGMSACAQFPHKWFARPIVCKAFR